MKFLVSMGKTPGGVAVGLRTVEGAPCDASVALVAPPNGGSGLVLQVNGLRLQLLRTNGRFRLTFNDVSGNHGS